ncbi:MAG: hypothetical protein WBG88_04335 [Mesorhizobium sp.]
MGTDLQFGQDIKRTTKVKRHPLNFLFDPLYPILVAAFVAPIAVWYFKIPVHDLFDFDLVRIASRWLAW